MKSVEMTAVFASAGFTGLTAAGAAMAPGRLEHFSTQAALEPQSSAFFSQGPRSWQQSMSAAAAVCCGRACAVPLASGNAAIESAIKATRMARPKCIA